MLMRKIIFPLMLLFLFLMGKNEAYAQYYLTKDGVEIPYLFMEGTRVYDEHRMIPDEQLLILLSDVDGVNYGERFLKARRSFKAGVGLTVTGGILGSRLWLQVFFRRQYRYICCLGWSCAGGHRSTHILCQQGEDAYIHTALQ